MRALLDRKSWINLPTASSYMVVNYHQLECIVTPVHSHCHPHDKLCVWDVCENSHDRSQVSFLPSSLPTYTPRHLMTRPCNKWRGDEEGRHGTTPMHCYDKKEMASHIIRLHRERPAHTAMYWGPEDGRRKRRRPKKTWRSTFKEYLEEMCVSWDEARRIASDRERWRLLVTRCSDRNRRTDV